MASTIRSRTSSGIAFAVALLICCGSGESPAPLDPPPAEQPPPRSSAPPLPRGLWVLCEGSQRVLENRQRLEILLEDARGLGVTDLFVQVYRGGRAWFDSSLADSRPYGSTWRASDGTGRDAFSLLIERAHGQGLRVHAWVNVLSLASNADARILRDLGPAAAAVDQKGRSILD